MSKQKNIRNNSSAKNDDNDPEDMHERTALFRHKDTAPEDKSNLAYYIFFLLGIGSLLPWNAFITASAYYRSRFCGTPFFVNFESAFSVAYSLSSEVSLVFVVLLRMSTVLYPLYIFTAIFMLTTALVLVPDVDGNLFFAITIGSILLVGIVASMVRSGVFSLGALFPPRYTQAIMGGIGMGGVIVSGLCIVTTALASGQGSGKTVPLGEGGCDAEPSVDWSAFSYFTVASLVLVSNIAAFLVIKSLPITKHYESQADSVLARPALIADSAIIADGDGMSLRKIERQDEPEDDESSLAAAWRVLKIIKLPAFSIFFTFTVSLGLYPGLTSLIVSEGSNKQYFAPTMFLLFNIGDFSGRLSCARLDVHTGGFTLRRDVVLGSLGRLVFFPLFMACNISGSVLPVVFMNDVWPYLFMLLFSYSAGVLATMSMMIAPSLVVTADKKVVGALMTFLLSTGLLAGSFVSFLSVAIATGR